MKTRKLLILLTFIIYLFVQIPFQYIKGFDVAKDNEFVTALQYMYKNGLTKYSNVNDFLPLNNLNREQASKFYSEFAKKSLGKTPNKSLKCDFFDLKDADYTLQESIVESCQLGLFNGYNGYFKPKDSLTKAQAIAVLVRALYGKQNEAVDPWWSNYYNKAKNAGLTKETNVYGLDKTVSRYEISLLLFRASDNSNSLTNVVNKSKVDDSIIDTIDKSLYKSNSFDINFDFAMNKQSVEDNFKLYPNKNVLFTWSGEQKLNVTIQENLDELIVKDVVSDTQEYLVNISDKAQSSTGVKLDKPIVRNFKLDGIPMVTFVSPSGEITDLSKNITVRFSKPMVPLTTLDNQPICPIEIQPSLPGKCVWITTSTFQFRPDNGFPIGGLYDVKIPSGIQTMIGDKTINSKEFKIKTPDFKIINTSVNINKDDYLYVKFNSEVNLEEFKNNFSINGFNNTELSIDFEKVNGNEINKNTIVIKPTNGDWGYGKSFQYNISWAMKSDRGNVSLGSDYSKTLEIKDFLQNVKPFVYIDSTVKNMNLPSNMKFSNNSDIIVPNDPMLLFEFYEEINLDKSLFKISNGEFNLEYGQKLDCSVGDCKVVFDKKIIVMKILASNLSSLNIDLMLGAISNSSNITKSFNTKNTNQILEFSFNDYYSSCITFKNKVDLSSGNLSYFDFGGNGTLSYMYQVYDSKYGSQKCKYRNDAFVYEMYTRLNPSTEISLNINQLFLDEDNYKLDKDYVFSFKTNDPLNEDKMIQFFDNRQLILVPKDINPLGIGFKSINIDSFNLKVCEGNLDVSNIDFIKNPVCQESVVPVNDYGFNTNFSVVDLNKIYGKEFTKEIVTVEISKLSEDRTTYDESQKVNFLRTNVSAVLKLSSHNNVLWLYDFKTGKLQADNVEQIRNYKRTSKYSILGKYLGEVAEYKEDIGFKHLSSGLYELNSMPSDFIIIKLKSNEEILVDVNYYNNIDNEGFYIYTDRPLYKPGDTVYIKGAGRIFTPSKLEISKGSYNLVINDSQYKQLVSQSVQTSELGTFEYVYIIPQDASLGNYSVSVGGSSINFAVEEYEKPDFKVEVTNDESSYLYGETALIDIKGEYYIGAPLSNGDGSYSIKAGEYQFDGGKTSGYEWGEKSFLWDWGFRFEDNSSVSVVYDSKFKLNSSGVSKLPIKLENPLINEDPKDMIYDMSVTLKDSNTQKTVNTNTSFKVLRSNTFVGMKMDKYYYDYGDDINLDFITVDINGERIANKKIIFELYKLEYEKNEDTLQYEQVEKLLDTKDLFTDVAGLEEYSYKLNDYGMFKLLVKVDGTSYKTVRNIYVSGSSLIRPKENYRDIGLIASKQEYKVGEKGQVVIQTDFLSGKALITVEKGNGILDYDVIEIKSNSTVYDIDIKNIYLPNVDVSVFAVEDSNSNSEILQSLQTTRNNMKSIEQELFSGNNYYDNRRIVMYDIKGIYNILPPTEEKLKYDSELLKKLSRLRSNEQKLLQQILPDYQYGSVQLKVSTDPVELNIQAIPNKNSFLPGEKVEISFVVKDSNGKAINGEGVISIVDEALLSLKSDNSGNILDYFYSFYSNNIFNNFNLSNIIKRIEFEGEIENNNAGNEPEVSLGGEMLYKSSRNEMSMDSAQESASLEDSDDEGTDGQSNSIRSDFRDIAYYKGKIVINDGVAKVLVDKLPDDLTTWKIRGFVITSDTKVGNLDGSFQTQKPISLIPSVPRFFIAGDNAQITALVVNNTDELINSQINLDVSNSVLPISTKSISVAPNSQGSVVFDVNVNPMSNSIDWNNYNSVVNMKLTSGGYSDAIQVTKQIFPYSTPEYTFTNGSTTDLSYEEKIVIPDLVDKTQGKLDISIGSNVLVNLTDNINSIAHSPYWNFYSILSAIQNGAVLKTLYNTIGESNKFEEIKVFDYLNKEWKLSELMNYSINQISNYQWIDGGFMSWDDCHTTYWREKCSDFSLTKEYLKTLKFIENAGYKIDQNITTKAINYYKIELQKMIDDAKKYSTESNFIEPLFVLSYFGEKDFIQKNLLSDYKNLSNLDNLYLIQLYLNTKINSDKIASLVEKVSNSILIEARGSLLPSNNDYWYYSSNVKSTALALSTFISYGEKEKLLVENFARWLLAQKNDDGTFGGWGDSVLVLDAINDYINFTGEFNNVDFFAEVFLNNELVLDGKFSDSNKFEQIIVNLPLSNLIFGSDSSNSLGLKKEGNGVLYYDIGLKYFLPIDEIKARDEGIIVDRNYYDMSEYYSSIQNQCDQQVNDSYGYRYSEDYGNDSYGVSKYYEPFVNCTKKLTKNLSIKNSGKQGEYLVGEIEIIVPHERNNVIVENFIPAGAELVNTNLDNSSLQVKEITGQSSSSMWYGGFDHVEVKNDKLLLSADRLYKGTYKFVYVIKLNHSGKYHHKPAVAYEIKKPEIWGRTNGGYFTITK